MKEDNVNGTKITAIVSMNKRRENNGNANGNNKWNEIKYKMNETK